MLQGLALAGLGAKNTSEQADQAHPHWQTVVARKPGGFAGSGGIPMLGLFRDLAARDIAGDMDAFVSRGFRTPGKGLALYVWEPNGRDLTIAGQRLLDGDVAERAHDVMHPAAETGQVGSLQAERGHPG